MIKLEEMNDICIQWGYWATPKIGTEYYSLNLAIPVRLAKLHECMFKPKIDEKLACEIEKNILIMRQNAPDLFNIFLLRYAYRLPYFNEYDKFNKLTKKGLTSILCISKATCKKRLEFARVLLCCMLNK